MGELLGWNDGVTHRQFAAWEVWRELMWDHPDRHDWYAMAIACEVRRVLSSNPGQHQPKDMKLVFGEQKPVARDPATLAAMSKAMLEARLGRKIHPVKAETNGDH